MLVKIKLKMHINMCAIFLSRQATQPCVPDNIHEEPPVQTFVTYIAALSVIHRDWDKREKRIVPKCKQKE